MAGLVPAIHAGNASRRDRHWGGPQQSFAGTTLSPLPRSRTFDAPNHVDSRDKPGHDAPKLVRNILLAEVPAVLRVDFLATAAIIGAIVLVVARSLKAPPISRRFWGRDMLRRENRCGLAASASADSKPALTNQPPWSSERKKNPASGGADAGRQRTRAWGAKTSALSGGNRASARLFPAEPESFACGISAQI
jgi:hypothetical protein